MTHPAVHREYLEPSMTLYTPCTALGTPVLSTRRCTSHGCYLRVYRLSGRPLGLSEASRRCTWHYQEASWSTQGGTWRPPGGSWRVLVSVWRVLAGPGVCLAGHG